MFVKEVVWLHGLPRMVNSDRGPQFTTVFSKRLCEQLGIERGLSTVFHPEMDRQTERVNASMEQYLRVFTSYQQDDWV
jgi:transposase InsO family protein